MNTVIMSLPWTSLDQLEGREISALFITTKANQAVDAFEQVAPHLQADAPVLLLHNGMGVYEELSVRHPDVQFFCGTTTEAAYHDGEGHFKHTGIGDTRIGRPGQQVMPDWFEPFANSGERFIWEKDIERSLWRKLIINCAINPLTTVHLCRNGSILGIPEFRAEAEAICEELADVTRARDDAELAGQVQAEAFAVMESTAENNSSMLQDRMHGRETEIEYITGYLCREAQRLGIPCPHNEALLEQVRRLDSEVVRP